jgi:hypothetical protein
MKTLIQENGGAPLFAEIRPVLRPADLVELRLLEQSNYSDELLVKLRIVLTPEERKRLKELL